jgi:hypothetical protein
MRIIIIIIICRGKEEEHTGFGWGKPKEKDHLEDLGAGGRIILKWIFKKWGGSSTGLISVRIRTSGGLL